jgi:hypothetical protein
MNLQEIYTNTKAFEAYMGKPQASYTPTKEEMYVLALNKREKKNEKHKKEKLVKQFKAEAELNTKKQLLGMIKMYNQNVNYSAIAKVYQTIEKENIDINRQKDDVIHLYQIQIN